MSGASDAQRRIVAFLARGEAALRREGSRASLVSDHGCLPVDGGSIEEMTASGLVQSDGRTVRLSASCRAALSRLPSTASLARDIDAIAMMTPDGLETVAVNVAESPLAQLARRKDKDGRPFLTAAEFRAGERLRADYTIGRIMPRVGANWSSPVSSGQPAGRAADLTDAALAGRQRVDEALRSVGPELAGVLVDVCCFLKGLETVEMERRWPARSAKIVLKTALSVLSRHYEPQRAASSAGQRPILHWGAPGFRPAVAI